MISNAAVLTGSATGGSGTDTLSMAAYTTPVSATLSAVAASGFNGSSNTVTSFAAIDSIAGGTAADTLERSGQRRLEPVGQPELCLGRFDAGVLQFPDAERRYGC